MGGIDVLGFGSDFDGIELWPEGLAHPGDYENLISLLYAHGYSEENVAAIAGGNLWRLLKKADALRGE
jgi:membrane dipeptidase